MATIFGTHHRHSTKTMADTTSATPVAASISPDGITSAKKRATGGEELPEAAAEISAAGDNDASADGKAVGAEGGDE